MPLLKSLKRISLTLTLGARLLSSSVNAEESKEKPKVLIFDVNETLLDLTSMRASIVLLTRFSGHLLITLRRLTCLDIPNLERHGFTPLISKSKQSN